MLSSWPEERSDGFDSSPPHTREPALWTELNTLLDALDGPKQSAGAAQGPLLVHMGLRMLSALGFGLEFSRCARCGRPCPKGTSGCFSPTAGGLVCRACGGAPSVIHGALRERMARLAEGEVVTLSADELDTALAIVDAALGAHT